MDARIGIGELSASRQPKDTARALVRPDLTYELLTLRWSGAGNANDWQFRSLKLSTLSLDELTYDPGAASTSMAGPGCNEATYFKIIKYRKAGAKGQPAHRIRSPGRVKGLAFEET